MNTQIMSSASFRMIFHKACFFLIPVISMRAISTMAQTTSNSVMEKGIHDTRNDSPAEITGYRPVAYHSPICSFALAAMMNATRTMRSICLILIFGAGFIILLRSFCGRSILRLRPGLRTV